MSRRQLSSLNSIRERHWVFWQQRTIRHKAAGYAARTDDREGAP
jgi:hypothetical protein